MIVSSFEVCVNSSQPPPAAGPVGKTPLYPRIPEKLPGDPIDLPAGNSRPDRADRAVVGLPDEPVDLPLAPRSSPHDISAGLIRVISFPDRAVIDHHASPVRNLAAP